MKKVTYIFKLGLLSLGLLVGSCTNGNILELDMTENPNALNPDQADPDFLLNAIQVNYGSLMESFGYTGGQLVRIDQMSGRDYANAYGPTAFDGEWSSAYRGIMQDIAIMEPLATEAGLNYHIAVGKFIKAHVLMTLVDYFGDVPNSEALDETNLNPMADSGSDVYAAALVMLDEAKSLFEGEFAAAPQNDFFYGGSATQWVKAVNTLKIKAYMTTRLVDSEAASKINAIVSSGDYIAAAADDLDFSWGSNDNQPDTRHPRYAGDYTATGGGFYRSNWMMDNMLNVNDPRRLYYFYRQTDATPGVGANPVDEETLECSLQTAPPHYNGYVFCGVGAGYWGRDHGNDNGIPPDGFLRTLHGVYPAGGTYDDGSFSGQALGAGEGGAGITPILNSAMVSFWLAELSYVGGDLPTAKSHMLDGLDASMLKVTSSYDSDNANEATVIASHRATIESAFDAAASNSDKMDVIAEQFLLASYGNGSEAYNFYRRTGFPTTLQPNIEPNPGGFIRSFYYPANFAANNSNVEQKSGVDVQIFWDTNSASPGFPVAN